MILTAILLAAVAWCCWRAYRRWQALRREEMAREIINAALSDKHVEAMLLDHIRNEQWSVEDLGALIRADRELRLNVEPGGYTLIDR